MNFLFFPNDAGGGFGHINMSLALADEAKERGHACAFVLSEEKFFPNISDSFKVFSSSCRPKSTKYLTMLKTLLSNPQRVESPLFIELSKVDYLVLRDGLINEEIITAQLKKYLEITRLFKPDVLVGDTNLLVWILSLMTAIPAVQVVRYLSHPKSANLIWWKAIPEKLLPPDALKLLNPLLVKKNLPKIKGTEELFTGDFYLVPSMPEIEPIALDGKTEFVGVLSSKKNEDVRFWTDQLDKTKPLIYLTIGGGARGVGNKKFFLTVIEAFKKLPVQLIISTGGKLKLTGLPYVPDNIKLFRWVPGSLFIERADLVIFHGGYTTMMEILTYGKPSIVIPFHSEQEGNGRRLEKLGCARVVKLSKQEYMPIECEWQYGKYNYLIQNRFDLTPDELMREVREVLNDDKYRKNAENIQMKLKKYGGPELALDLLERKFQ